MPKAAAKPCRHAGCSKRATSGAYCDDHQADASVGKFSDSRRGSRHERGYGASWERIRKRILRRDKGLCQVCLAAGRYRPAKAVDHIVPKFEDGTDDDENLQAICQACHDMKTTAEAARARKKAAG